MTSTTFLGYFNRSDDRSNFLSVPIFVHRDSCRDTGGGSRGK